MMNCITCYGPLDDSATCPKCPAPSGETLGRQRRGVLWSIIHSSVNSGGKIPWAEVKGATTAIEKYGINADEIETEVARLIWRHHSPLLVLSDDDLKQVQHMKERGLQVHRLSGGPWRHGFSIVLPTPEPKYFPVEHCLNLGDGEITELPIGYLCPTETRWVFEIDRFGGDFVSEFDTFV